MDSTKSLFPLKLSGFWLIQAAWGFLCCLPVTLLNSVSASAAPIGGGLGDLLGEILRIAIVT